MNHFLCFFSPCSKTLQRRGKQDIQQRTTYKPASIALCSKRTESSVWQRALWTRASTLFRRQLFRRAIICKPYFVYIPILRKERQGQCVKTSLRCLPLVSYGRATATCRGQISRSRERNGSRAARTCQEWKRSGTGSRMDHPLTVGGISANC